MGFPQSNYLMGFDYFDRARRVLRNQLALVNYTKIATPNCILNLIFFHWITFHNKYCKLYLLSIKFKSVLVFFFNFLFSKCQSIRSACIASLLPIKYSDDRINKYIFIPIYKMIYCEISLFFHLIKRLAPWVDKYDLDIFYWS